MASAKAEISIVDAKRGDISEIIEAGGRVCGNRDMVVNCVASGEVVKLPVSVGDWVKKGDLICRLDPAQEQKAVDDAKTVLSRAVRKLEQTQESARLADADLGVSLQQAEESINSLRVKATNLRNKADRQKSLLAQSLSSQEEFETAETDASEAETEFRNAVLAKEDLKDRRDMLKNEQAMHVESVEDDVRNAQTAVKNASDRLNSTTITSPIDGIVSDVKTSLETWIEQSGGEYARQPVATITDLSRLFLTVSIGERKVGLVHVGDKAQIRADSYPGRSFPGTVTWVAPTGVSNGDIVTFWVKIEVEGPDKALLKPAMTAVARIVQ
jgi:multidrug resistance efflux pump